MAYRIETSDGPLPYGQFKGRVIEEIGKSDTELSSGELSERLGCEEEHVTKVLDELKRIKQASSRFEK